MRRAGLLLALAIFAGSASPAAAHHEPPACTANNADMVLDSNRTATVQLKVGRRIVATKRVKLDSRCRYRVRFTNVSRRQLRGATRVSVTVRSGRRTATHRVAVPRT